MASTDKAGQSIVDAIYEKYDDSEETLIYIHVPASAPGKKESGHICVPPILALHDSNISESGDPDKLESLCNQVQELDLTKNSIRDWQQVIRIVERIPKLRFINLTSNQIENQSSWQYDKQFPNISVLILNNTGVSWDCLVKVLKLFPSVTELHLSLNEYSTVDLPADFKYLPVTKLFLNSNKIQDWRMMCHLGHCFPNLETFVAMESDLSSLDSDTDMKETFPCLKSLNLAKTNLSSWEDMEMFREFPVLEDLRIKDIPFLQKYPEKERRQNIVARLPNITKLNGSPVHDQEREEAERAFIRQFLDVEDKPNRFFELEKIHGKLQHLADINLAPSDLTFHLKVKFEDKEEIMEISKEQKVKDLKKTLQNFSGLSAKVMKVYQVGTKNEVLSEMMSNERFLHSYDWTGIDELHIF